MLTYKNYKGYIDYDEANAVFYGRVLGVSSILCFEGATSVELEQSFKDVIDTYLAHCEKTGKNPDRFYSGKTLLRMPPNLHRRLAEKAEMKQESLNSFLVESLQSVL